MHPHQTTPTSSGVAALKRRGFNLVEAAIVLGVVGLVIGGIWVAASAVSSNQKLAEMTKGLGYANERLRQLAPSLGSTPTTLISWLTRTGPGIHMAILPSDWITNGIVTPPFSEVREFGIDYNGSGGFQYTVGGVNKQSCLALLPKMAYTMKLGGALLALLALPGALPARWMKR